MSDRALELLQQEIRRCRACASQLPMPPRPVFQLSGTARLLIVSQAPGSKAHGSGVPFTDASGDRLREWMGIERNQFYSAAEIAILPIGLCYPGKKGGGDAPPRSECGELWRADALALMPGIRLTLLVGSYAQADMLGPGTVTERVRSYCDYLPTFFPLPHPSWRVVGWSRNNPWFERDVLPALRKAVRGALSSS